MAFSARDRLRVVTPLDRLDCLPPCLADKDKGLVRHIGALERLAIGLLLARRRTMAGVAPLRREHRMTGLASPSLDGFRHLKVAGDRSSAHIERGGDPLHCPLLGVEALGDELPVGRRITMLHALRLNGQIGKSITQPTYPHRASTLAVLIWDE